MKYQAIQISQRTEQVKRIYSGLTVPQMTDPYHPTKYKPFGTGDRLITLGYLRGYEKHASAETVRLRASYAPVLPYASDKFGNIFFFCVHFFFLIFPCFVTGGFHFSFYCLRSSRHKNVPARFHRSTYIRSPLFFPSLHKKSPDTQYSGIRG